MPSYIPETTDPLIGTTVAGRYRIERKLGEGGMGSVYVALHTILEKRVAIKVLHGEFARKPELVERFMQEAKAASRIRHQNVIDISDFGTTPEGLVFFAMELLEGHDLQRDIAHARQLGQLLPWERSKKIFLQICAALSAAHAKGIVHRDLKPENIYLIEQLGDPDFVKLLDFGIAKLTEVNEEGRKLTKTGMLFGTPEYMAPEQARGEHVDLRVDVYAMGCILFQLVSGVVPFHADNFMGVLSLHLTEPPPVIAPETFDMIGAPRALAGVIDRALAKNKDERYQSIEELAGAVREVCGDPAPADRSAPVRAPSVPAPAQTTRARTPSGVVQPVTREPTGRTKTAWTGSPKVPEIEIVDEPAARPKSKLPLVLGAVVLVAGAAVATVAVLGSGGDKGAAGGSAAPVAGSAVAGSAAVAPPAGSAANPVTVPQLPATVKLAFDSTPSGALVIDLANNQPIGKTPARLTVPGSATPRRFKFQLRGYIETTVELVPDRPVIEYAETLQKGTGTGRVVAAAGSAASGSGSGSAAKVEELKQPDLGSAATPPQPPPPPPRANPCPDDDTMPCLKEMPPAGSGT